MEKFVQLGRECFFAFADVTLGCTLCTARPMLSCLYVLTSPDDAVRVLKYAYQFGMDP